jgi:hypothetical protein
MINRYFILLLLPIVLSSCSSSPQPKTQQRPLATAQRSVSTASQTSDAESDTNANLDENSTPIEPIATQGKSYSPQLVNNFMGACIQKGSSQTTCGCMLNTLEQNFSEPEYIRMEQQLSATGKLPEFVIQEISNNCSNSKIQTPIARSQQEYFDYEEQRRFRQLEQQAAIERANQFSADQSKSIADMPKRMAEASESALKYSSAVAGVGFRNEHPCDYPNQRDSQGNSCGDRSAVVRPGGRF